MPNLYVIAGPNGAGKTTYAEDFLLHETSCRQFVNADLIAAGLSPLDPERAIMDAARVMLQRLEILTSRREDFAFETTLSSLGQAAMLRELRATGYRIRLDFLWVPDLEITRNRVRQRVMKGGHDVPEELQRIRFRRGIRNLAEFYRPLVDHWRLYDNSGARRYLLAEEKDHILRVVDATRLAFLEREASIRFMPETPPPAVGESAEYVPSEETRRSMRAMRRAFARVVLENKAWGLPVIQWREGRGVVEVPPEQLEPLARRILEVNGDPLPEAEEHALLAHLKI